jgi:hypothetical protein
MKQKEIIEKLKAGGTITKQSVNKYKRNKIVKGSFYEYDIDGEKITEKQFDALYENGLIIKDGVSQLLSIKTFKYSKPQ